MAFFHLNPDGYFYFKDYHHKHITESPIGILVHNLTAYRPLSASVKDSVAEVNYPCGVCRIEISELTDYVKLKLLSIPEGSDGFIFGPYETDAISAGEIIGAAWQEDKTVVCIQSLMPKVVEGASVPYSENQSGTELSKRERAAVLYDGKVSLQLSAVDMSRETKLPTDLLSTPFPIPTHRSSVRQLLW